MTAPVTLHRGDRGLTLDAEDLRLLAMGLQRINPDSGQMRARRNLILTFLNGDDSALSH
jgi:hypothetical protein